MALQDQPGRLRPIDTLTAAEAAGLVGVLCDIDDTLTWEGRLRPEAFAALAAAQAAGLAVIPVTGRPGGWVDHIARMWPVQGVVGENGGLWFYMEQADAGPARLRRCFLQPAAERASNRLRLDALGAQILAAVPGTALASDQPYRELDLAIDFCEDVPRLPEAAVDRIVACFDAAGATCKVSSIHVNGWYGGFDKLTGFERLAGALGLTADPARWIFVGDSANDAPMFSHFPRSVGVANVDDFLHRIPVWPAFRAPLPGGAGFAQVIAQVLARRPG